MSEIRNSKLNKSTYIAYENENLVKNKDQIVINIKDKYDIDKFKHYHYIWWMDMVISSNCRL